MGLSKIGAIPLTIVGATGCSIVGAMACWASVQHADRTDQRRFVAPTDVSSSHRPAFSASH